MVIMAQAGCYYLGNGPERPVLGLENILGHAEWPVAPVNDAARETRDQMWSRRTQGQWLLRLFHFFQSQSLINCGAKCPGFD